MSEVVYEDGPRLRAGWLALAAGAVIVWSLIALPGVLKAVASEPPGAAYWGGLFGTVMVEGAVAAGVVWALLQFVCAKPSNARFGAIYFAVLYTTALAVPLLMAALVVPGARQRHRQEAAQIHTMNSEIAAAGERLMASDGPPIDLHAKATGQAGELELIMKRSMSGMIQTRADYRRDFEGLDLARRISPSGLARADLPALRRDLDAALPIIERYRAKSKADLVQVRADVRHSSLPPDVQQQFLKGFDNRVEREGAAIDHLWDLEAAVIHDVAAKVDFLSRRKGHWRARGQTIVFDNKPDLEVARGINAAITRDAKEELVIQSGARAEMREGLGELRNAATTAGGTQ